MPVSDSLFKFIAARLHIPGDALAYFFASRHLGPPSETALPFPAELIPLGSRLFLRGWLNNRFFPSNRAWVLPFWAERQFDPASPSFLPRGLNLYTLNYMHRDWTMIGNVARAREAVVDPRGLVTPWFDGWSLDIWVGIDGELFAPSRLPDSAITQSLHENLPFVVTNWRARDLAISTQAYAAQEEQGGEWVIQEVEVHNQTFSSQRATLYFAVRPFNPEGVSLIHKLDFRERSENAAFFVDDALAIVMLKPDAVACAEFKEGDVALELPIMNGKRSARGPAGLATGLAAYALDLSPGERKTFSVSMTMERVEPDDDELAPPSIPPISDLRAAAISTWRARLAEGMRVHLPDERLQNAFEANKAFLLLLHDGTTITPGPFTYHQFWMRDAAFLLNALDKLGYHAESRSVLQQLPRRLEKDGYLRSTEGEWDSNGAALWTMVEHAQLSGDKSLVAENYWSLLRMAAWINSKRQKTKTQGQPRSPQHGLLPAGPSAEHLGPSDNYYWDDFWGLAGLRAAAQVADWLEQKNDAQLLRANYAAFAADVDASLASAAARIGRPAMPASPTRRLDAAMIGSLAAAYPLRLFAPDDPRVVDTIAALRSTAWIEDAYYNDVGHSAIGTYLTLHVAQALLFQRDPAAWNILEWVLRHASPTYTWAEGLHPRTRHGCMGDGHHGWALADFLLAVRNLLLFEEDDHLVITPVLPEDWTAESLVIKVQDAATYFGKVNFTIAFGERAGTLVVDGDWHAAPAYIEWNLPFPLREVGAETEGVELVGKRVRLPREARRVVVMW